MPTLDDAPDTLRLMFRNGPQDRSMFADDYQRDLQGALGELRALGFAVDAPVWDNEVERVSGRLTGTFLFSLTTFPPEVGRVMAHWLALRPERRVCVVLGDFVTNAFTPADAEKIASPANPERPNEV